MAASKILLVGCGKMGGALLHHIASHAAVCVVEPNEPPAQLKTLPGVAWVTSAEGIDPNFKPDIIVLAIKPQQMKAALPAYGKYENSIFLSIAAGQSFAHLGPLLGGKAYTIVRAMPNLNASVGKSITVVVANKNVSPEQRKLCEKVLGSIGKIVWIEDEHWLDAVTALSGSGPAYVFSLVEVMQKVGESLGLPAKLAAQLARETIIGSGELLAHSPETAEELRLAVTSPGGTTEAALQQLLAKSVGLPALMNKAMRAAFERARELSSK